MKKISFFIYCHLHLHLHNYYKSNGIIGIPLNLFQNILDYINITLLQNMFLLEHYNPRSLQLLEYFIYEGLYFFFLNYCFLHFHSYKFYKSSGIVCNLIEHHHNNLFNINTTLDFYFRCILSLSHYNPRSL